MAASESNGGPGPEPSRGEPSEDRPAPSARALSALSAAAVLALFAVVGGLMARPWIGRAKPLAVVAFTGVTQGEAQLELRSDGKVGGDRTWVSVNSELIAGPDVYTKLRDPWRSAVLSFAGLRAGHDVDPGVLERLIVQRRVRRGFDATGAGGTVVDVYILGPTGQFWIGQQLPGLDPTTFDPPARTLPADPSPGRHWTARGTVHLPSKLTLPYRYDGSMSRPTTVQTAYGRQPGCVTRIGRLLEGSHDGAGRHMEVTYCPGLGTVDERDGLPPRPLDDFKVQVVAGRPATAEPPLLPAPSIPVADPGPTRGWRLEPLGRSSPPNGGTNASAAPLYVPAQRPVVVVSDDLSPGIAAIDPQNPGTVSWRFSTAGSVLGSSSTDPRRGRVYFGTSDKRVYAVDSRGVFLWSAATRDNVAAPPVAAGNLVIVAGEDGTVRGLDADSGRQRWSAKIGQPLAAAPALIGDRVAIAGDDGIVRALRVRDGRRLWTYDTGAPVEAGLLAGRGRVVVANRDGALSSLDAADGALRWKSDTGGSVRVVPAAWGDRVATVSESGTLRVFDATGGRVLWSRSPAAGFHLGPAATLGDQLVVARADGVVEAFDRAGRRTGSWSVPNADTLEPASTAPPTFGVSVGGGAVWWSGRGGMLYRLGPPVGARHLRLAWRDVGFRGPFGAQPATAAAAWRGRIVLFDYDGRLYLVDGATGAVTSGRRAVPAALTASLTGPVVGGDVALVDLPDRLLALHLPDGRELWQHRHGAASPQAPVVSGSSVVLTAGSGAGSEVSALDLATGRVRWSHRSGPGYGAQGAAVSGDLVVAGSPLSGWSLATGRLLWSSDTVAATSYAVTPDGSKVVAWLPGIGGRVGQLAVLAAGTGRRAFTVQTGVAVAYGDRLLATDSLVVAADSHRVTAIDLSFGTMQWGFTLPESSDAPPVTTDGALFLALADGAVWRVDLAGGYVTAAHQGIDQEMSRAAGTPIAVGGHLVFATPAAVWAIDPRMPR